MIVIFGLVVLLVAAMVGIVGVLGRARRGKVPLLGRWLDDRPTSSIGPGTFSPTRPILKH